MGVILSFNGRKAILRRGEWRSPDPRLEERLRRTTEEWFAETGGPALRARDPEAEVAKAVAERAGGRVVLHVPADARREGRLYFRRRQMRLPFMD